MNYLKKYAANRQGRDFVCGDLHGQLTSLFESMAKVQFDPQLDRLFSVGDLVDRGEQSKETFELLHEPWFHAIRGNHEAMMFKACESGNARDFIAWMNNGAEQWVKGDQGFFRSHEYFANFVQQMSAQMPWSIELSLRDGRRVGLVHAELPLNCSWNDVCLGLSGKRSTDNSTYTPLLHGMFWHKGQASSIDAALGEIEPVDHVDHVFHGHTIMREITRCANRTFMDLGGYETGTLGLLNVEKYLKLSDSETPN